MHCSHLTIIRFLTAVSLLFTFFLLSSCVEESGVEFGTSPYENKSVIKILDLETGKQRVLRAGMYPRVSPYTEKVFFCDKDGLCCINTDGTGFLRLVSGIPYIQNYNFSPDGKKLVLRLVESTGKYPTVNNLYILNIDGSGMSKVCSYKPPYDPSPVFSPTMDRIVFTDSKDIVSVDLQGCNYKVIKAKTDSSFYQYIHFLPGDNDRIIYSEVVQDNKQNTTEKLLKVYTISTGQETLIGKYDPGFDFEFSENGKMLITFSRGNWHAGIFDINKNFAFSDVLAGFAWNSISPDGSKVASSKLNAIQLTTSNGTDSRTVLSLSDSVHVTYLKITRDGKHIVYQHNYNVLKDSF